MTTSSLVERLRDNIPGIRAFLEDVVLQDLSLCKAHIERLEAELAAQRTELFNTTYSRERWAALEAELVIERERRGRMREALVQITKTGSRVKMHEIAVQALSEGPDHDH